MSAQGLEVIESSTHKTHEWIASIAETAHLEKRDAYRALRAVLQTGRSQFTHLPPTEESAGNSPVE